MQLAPRRSGRPGTEACSKPRRDADRLAVTCDDARGRSRALKPGCWLVGMVLSVLDPVAGSIFGEV